MERTWLKATKATTPAWQGKRIVWIVCETVTEERMIGANEHAVAAGTSEATTANCAAETAERLEIRTANLREAIWKLYISKRSKKRFDYVRTQIQPRQQAQSVVASDQGQGRDEKAGLGLVLQDRDSSQVFQLQAQVPIWRSLAREVLRCILVSAILEPASAEY
jgi:hypothetical protein